jgi:cytochrome c oxidase assembly protein subunit 15
LATLGRATPGALVPAVAIGNVLGGMLMACLLWWLALGSPPARPIAPGWVRALSWAALLLTLGQIGLGVLTSASFSGLACPALPLCTADGFPGSWSYAELNPWTADTGRASAHMAHRLMALAATVAVALLAVSRHTGKRARLALLALLALQALVGVSMIALALPLTLAVVHNLLAALLLLALVAAHHRLTRRSETASELI